MKFYSSITSIPGLTDLEPKLRNKVWNYCFKKAWRHWPLWGCILIIIANIIFFGLSLIMFPSYTLYSVGFAVIAAQILWLVLTNIGARYVPEGLIYFGAES
jgi:hypothetical protein